MKNLLSIVLILVLFSRCKTNKTNTAETADNPFIETQDTIRIANDKLEYEIVIIDFGFKSWMTRRAQPREYYTQSFLESRNIPFVLEWNRRVVTAGYDPNLYEMTIAYRQGIDYGFEVNYMLYNYFVFFQEKYNQKLSSYVPGF